VLREVLDLPYGLSQSKLADSRFLLESADLDRRN